MNIRICLIVAAATLGVIVAGAVIGNILESAGLLTREGLGPKGVGIVKLFYLFLFMVLGLALVPLLFKAFLALQIRIGNGEAFPVQWLLSHERSVVYGFWGLIVLGLLMALPAAWRNGFFK